LGVGKAEGWGRGLSAHVCQAHTKADFDGWGFGFEVGKEPNPERRDTLTITQLAFEVQFPRDFYNYNKKDLPWCFAIPLAVSPSTNQGTFQGKTEWGFNYEHVFSF